MARVVESPLQPPNGNETIPAVPLYNAVTGSHRLLQNGVVDPDNNFSSGNLAGANPRTAVGVTNNLDGNAKKLLLVTVDGRQAGFSEGVTLAELANLMASYGATDAINLDGGGSTTMAINYYGDASSTGASYGVRLRNSPVGLSDVPTTERSVGTSLALFAATSPSYVHQAPPPSVSAGFTVLDDFEANEGRFTSAATTSGSTFGISSASPIDRVLNESYYGLGSQRITVQSANPGSPGLGLRHLSGNGTPGNNVALPSNGYLGFFLKALPTGLQTGQLRASIIVDDGAGHEQATSIDVVADGDWHLYQWNLDDDSAWSSFLGGDGQLNAPTITLDSIFLTSSQNIRFNVFVDLLVHNPNGDLSALTPPLGQPGDFDGDTDVDGADFLIWQRGDSPGGLNSGDLQLWKDNMGAPAFPAAAATPEPTATLLALAAVALFTRARVRNRFFFAS